MCVALRLNRAGQLASEELGGVQGKKEFRASRIAPISLLECPFRLNHYHEISAQC